MLTEFFLNNCFSLVFSDSPTIQKDLVLYRDILEIINFYKEKDSLDIPIIVKNKVDCLSKICEMKLGDKENGNIIDSLCSSEKYKQLSDFLQTKSSEKVEDKILIDNVKQIRLRKRLFSLLSNYDNISKFVESVKSGSFESIDSIVEDYERVVKELYTNMMEDNRGIAIEASSSLDLAKDDYTHVVEMIRKKYDKTNTTPTGFQIFDSEVFSAGGFEPSRLYVFGGGSGAGKSTLLNDFIANVATNSSLNRDPTKKKVYIYITLENTIEEALLRIYQSLTDKNSDQALRDALTKGPEYIKNFFRELLKKNNSTVIMKYFAPHTISPVDVMMVLDETISEYGKDSIKGLYIDYLDLLASDTESDLYRLELGHITVSLKTIAVHYNIPVITATQLGRGAYRIQDSRNLNLDQISESIKKVEHADFICLLARDEQKEGIVHVKIGKNRSGKANIALDFTVDFSCYKFKIGTKVSNSGKPNVTTDTIIGFGGLDNITF